MARPGFIVNKPYFSSGILLSITQILSPIAAGHHFCSDHILEIVSLSGMMPLLLPGRKRGARPMVYPLP